MVVLPACFNRVSINSHRDIVFQIAFQAIDGCVLERGSLIVLEFLV